MVGAYWASKSLPAGTSSKWVETVYENEEYWVDTYVASEEDDPFQTQFLFFDMDDNNIANIEISYADLVPFMEKLNSVVSGDSHYKFHLSAPASFLVLSEYVL